MPGSEPSSQPPAPGGEGSGGFSWALGAVGLALGLLILAAPLAVLLDRFLPDDAFYYFNTARWLAETGRSTFDGIHHTNGYQPLWLLLSVPAFWIFPEGGEAPVRLLLSLQVVLSAATLVLLVRLMAGAFGLLAGVLGTIPWLVVMQRVQVNGLETALQMLFFAAAMLQAVKVLRPGARAPAVDWLLLGTLAGLLFLARTDSAFGVAALAVAAAWKLRGEAAEGKGLPARAVPRGAAFLLPVLVLAGGYLLHNLVTTGHLMPVSGAAKQYHSSLAREAALRAAGSAWNVHLQNLVWPFTERNHVWMGIGIAGPWALLLLARLTRGRALRDAAEPFRTLWPFGAGATMSWLFYSTAFHGGFTRTIWYWGPHVFLACLAVAAGVGALRSATRDPVLTLVLAAPVLGLLLGWIRPLDALAVAAAGTAAALLLRHRLAAGNRGTVLLAMALALAIALVFALGGPNLSSWRRAVYVVLAAVVVSRFPSWRPACEGLAALLLVGATCVVHATNLRNDVAAPPGHWNHHLHQGALWAREALPEDATLWSGSAGILGYFSGRRVVNTDGLANSHHFLKHVLAAGRLHEFVRQWDYAVDAFPDPNDLPRTFPGGSFVELPPGVQPPPFPDGDWVRRLQVFRMPR